MGHPDASRLVRSLRLNVIARTQTRFPAAASLLVIAAGAALALLIGSLAGNPSWLGTALLAVIIAVSGQVLVVRYPYVAFLILAGTPFVFMCFALNPDRYLNAFDFMVPLLFVTGWLGRARYDARAADSRFTRPEHIAVHEA